MPDSEHVTVVVTLTQKDYAAALRAFAKHGTGWVRRVIFWASIAFLGWMFYSLLRNSETPLLSGALVVGSVAFFALAFYYVLPAFSARLFVKKNPGKLGPIRVSIGQDGLAYEGVHGEGTTKWSAYHRIRETKDLFLLYPQSNFAQIFPKRCFEKPDDRERFRQLLTTYYKGKLHLLS